MTEQRVREKKEAFMNNPRQGRMVQLYKPPTTNVKHAHPKLEVRRKKLLRDHRRQRMVTWNSRLAYRHFFTFLTLEDVIKKLLFKIY